MAWTSCPTTLVHSCLRVADSAWRNRKIFGLYMTVRAQRLPLGQPAENKLEEALPEPKVGHAFEFEDRWGETSLEVEEGGS